MQFREPDGTLVTVYSPNEQQGWIFWTLKQAWRDLAGSRDIMIRLFLRDFLPQFRQRILGYFWALLSPLIGIASFVFLYFVGVLNPGVGDIPYPIFTLLGASIWGCLAGTMGAVSNGLMAQADLVMRTDIPKSNTSQTLKSKIRIFVQEIMDSQLQAL